MRLSPPEFRAMNNPVRRLSQRRIEFPQFKALGLDATDKDVLEVGCGSGYGAVLLSTQGPRSYHGIDLMSEQIALTEQWGLPSASFSVMDASRLDAFATESFDVVVVFGILHHMPRWREALAEAHRVLRPAGQLFVEEPDMRAIQVWDRMLHWGHSPEAAFSLQELEEEIERVGFAIGASRRFRWVGWYRADRR
jgi:ubiquinone/menaquinone biosynthesis C-methylase UbiE